MRNGWEDCKIGRKQDFWVRCIELAKHSLLTCPVLDKYVKKIFILKTVKINLAGPNTEIGLIKEIITNVKASLRKRFNNATKMR